GATAAAKDIGKGLYQAPVQIAGGAADAVKELSGSADSLANWLNDHVANLRVPFPSTGSERLDKWIDNPTTLVRDLVPDIDRRDGVTSNLIRDSAQFVTGMYL